MFIKNQTKIVFVVLLMVVLAASFGCGKSADKPNDQGNGKLSGNIQIAGSTSVQPIAEELATVFMEKNSGVNIEVQGGGTSAGIKAAVDGVANIGMASRELKDEEKGLGLTAKVIAKDGIAIVVNPANQVSDLTMEQVKGIFSGEVTNWKEIGGSDTPIVVINREEGSGTRGAFEELVLGKDVKFTESAAIQNSTGAVRTGVASDPNAVGYISMGSLEQSVKALKIDGVEPNEEKVLDGTYKISRPFNFLTKGEPTELSKAFIDLILSSEGQEIVSEEFVPINK